MPPKVVLFDQGFVRHILLVYTDAMGKNERQVFEKGQQSMMKYEYLSPLFARMILRDIWTLL